MPSKIEWTNETWNPTVGCSKISPGCKFCYAIREARRLAHNPNQKIADAYSGLTVLSNSGDGANWTGVVKLVPDRLALPLSWRIPKMIFVDSMSDLFHDEVRESDIRLVLSVAASAARLHGHVFQFLTKRARRMAEIVLAARWYNGLAFQLPHLERHEIPLWCVERDVPMHLAPARRQIQTGLWFGFSAENQQTFEERWRWARQLAAAGWMVWCSYEPALGPLDARKALAQGLRWIVAGGESGPRARSAAPEWFRRVRDDCAEFQVPFLFKQWGRWSPTETGGRPERGRNVAVGDGTHHRMFPVGKKLSGRILDAQILDQYPANGVRV